MGFTEILGSLFGNKSKRDLKKIMPLVEQIKAVSPSLENISNDELRAKVAEARARIENSVSERRNRIKELKAEVETLDFEKREAVWEEIDHIEKEILEELEHRLNEELPSVFAAVKETARRFKDNELIEVTATDFDRKLAGNGADFLTIDGDKAVYRNHWMAGGNEITWDMVHYDVQLIGGIVLHQGKIAEMATGEGKTLVATLPVFLNALTGNGVHVVTVNDYLAKRDSEWMGPLYMFHGISVACIDKTQPNTQERREAYNADITFGTNNEFGFDYLRDNMAHTPSELVQRAHNFAIVDEVDSVLIDDARTPLIISGPTEKSDDQMFMEYKPNVVKVYDAQRKLVTQILADAKTKVNSDDKKEREEGALLLYRAYKGLPKYGPLIKFLSQDGMRPLMLEAEAKYMQDNAKEMYIVTDPLYFIIDEKNNSVELTDKGNDVLAQNTGDPQFFVLPDITAQMSEIAALPLSAEEIEAKKDEALQDYSIKSERVHTVIQLLKAYTLFENDIQYVVINNEVKIVDEGTGRIMEGRRYSDGLHQAIEAKENVKVQGATQTFATITLQNYFRMYHKLSGMTGTAETEAGEFWDIYKLDVVTIPTNRPIARVDMNDRLYKTAKEKYAAVIQEIEETVAKGRPVLVGTTSVEISQLLSRMLTMRNIPHNVLNAKRHQQEAEIVAQAGRRGQVTIATNMAGRGTDIKLTPEVREAGGLAIIGTARHDSRRVDRQLRGRSGRQGDPGSSVFYVSFEDDVMRMFAGDRTVKLLDRMGLKEGERIESNLMSKSVETAQKRVEENNFGIRKRLLEYDDVMNAQRNVIYTKRHHALMGERIGVDIMNMFYDTIENLADVYSSADDYNDFTIAVLRIFAIGMPFTEDEFRAMNRADVVDSLYQAVVATFKTRGDKMAETTFEVVNKIHTDQPEAKGLMQVPIIIGQKRRIGISVDFVEAYNTQCRSIVKMWHKAALLMSIDNAWQEHLRDLDQLKQSVQNASYEQKDPLLIYKLESFELFKAMVNKLNEKAISMLMRGQVPVISEEEQAKAQQVREEQMQRRPDVNRYKAQKEEYPGQDAQRAAAAAPQGPRGPVAPIIAGPRVGRNDPCPCGSGKKFKNCHGQGQ
ncbi:MAG: preprotein translocase subunit SecA [Muribaculaceae bacterium]|nr:preprotein translocase subunit SecA [Muribaculaceae bacterium]